MLTNNNSQQYALFIHAQTTSIMDSVVESAPQVLGNLESMFDVLVGTAFLKGWLAAKATIPVVDQLIEEAHTKEALDSLIKGMQTEYERQSSMHAGTSSTGEAQS
jgi:hypothetical protein